MTEEELTNLDLEIETLRKNLEVLEDEEIELSNKDIKFLLANMTAELILLFTLLKGQNSNENKECNGLYS